jgi:hypothetical protein
VGPLASSVSLDGSLEESAVGVLHSIHRHCESAACGPKGRTIAQTLCLGVEDVVMRKVVIKANR